MRVQYLGGLHPCVQTVASTSEGVIRKVDGEAVVSVRGCVAVQRSSVFFAKLPDVVVLQVYEPQVRQTVSVKLQTSQAILTCKPVIFI